MAELTLKGVQTPAAGPPLTNADKFRNMTDEELAEWLFPLCTGDLIGFCQNKEWCIENIPNIPQEHCKQCLLDWLKGSAE